MHTNPEIYRNNMKTLEERYPELAQQVKYTRITSYEIFQNEGCIPNVKHVSTGRTWYVGGLAAYFDEQWKGMHFENIKYPVFLGIGLGYEVLYFLTKYGEKMAVQGAVVIERDIEMFVCAMNTTDLTQMLSKPEIKIIVGLPAKDIYITMRNYFPDNMRDVLFAGTMYPIFNQSAMEIDKIYYQGVYLKFLESAWDSLMNYGNCPEDSLIGLENMLDNINEIVNNPGINMLYDKLKDKPAIVVATGPSLKKNMHLLKGLEDKALIISVDASLKLLLQNGIKPHMVTSLEREHAVQQFFDEIPYEDCKDTYMTACPVLFNHVYESYNGPKIIAYRNFDHFKWLGVDKGILDIKLSSSNMAFTIAKALGCEPIILVGQDLAYGDEGETHATSVPFSSAGEHEFDVRGNVKEIVRTNDGWFSFLKALEVDINNYTGKVYNCTEGGAYVAGTEVKPLQDIIDKYITEEINPLEIIQETLKDFGESQIASDREKLIPLFDSTISDLENIIALCRQGELLGDDSTLEENLKLRNEIQTKYAETYQKFIMHVVQSFHLANEMQFAINQEKPKDWFRCIGGMVQICLDSLLKSKNKLCGEDNARCGSIN